MTYKLMAVDIDGTLLDSNGKLTDETRRAVRMGVGKGLIFVISSGRPVQGVKPLVEELDLDLPIITYNGAMVIKGKSMEILYEQRMSPQDARDIIEIGEKYGTAIMVWKENKLYVNKMSDKAVKYGGLSKTVPILAEDMEAIISGGVSKILWYDNIDLIERYEKEVGSYLHGNVNYHTSQPFFLEFVDKKASKAIAMEKLGENYGIKQSEMIAIGDGFNDLSMIEYAGLGIAMGNAKDAIKDKADFVTLSNDEDGVAHAIYRFVLGVA